MIQKENYYSDAILEQEIARLFRSGFQFAGFLHELANDRDFVCVDFLGTTVVVQNFKGAIKAFENVCTHRFNRIQTEDRGNGPLRCRYHGWTFDASGFPVGLPKRDQFLAADGSNAAALCLPEYRVESCGSFVFFTRADNAQTLADYLGDYARVLEELSRHIGAETHFGHIPHAANWKLLVENVLECYHCAIVHPETFVTGLGVGLKPIEQIEFSSLHSSSHFPRSETKRENLRKKLLAHLDAREFAHDSFFHIYIFPNLFISSTEGTPAVRRAREATGLRRSSPPLPQETPRDPLERGSLVTAGRPPARAARPPKDATCPDPPFSDAGCAAASPPPPSPGPPFRRSRSPRRSTSRPQRPSSCSAARASRTPGRPR